MHSRKKFLIIVVLGLLSAIGPFSIDMYLPGFPSIAEDLHTTVARVSLSLSSFFIGISFGQLLYGPLLDRYGRKKPLYVGLSLYALTSLGCAFAANVEMLIVLRFFQAMGGCAGMVASRAMVRDIFPVEESAKVFSRLVLVIGVSPIIAPTVGGYISTHFGWPYVFVILTVMAIIILAASRFLLSESHAPDTGFSLMPRSILRSFKEVLTTPQFYTYAFTGSFAAAGLYAYISGSPYVFMKIYNVTEEQYGWIFALIAAGLIIASQLNSYFLRWYKSEQIIGVALLCQSITGAWLFIASYFGWLELYTTILLIFIFLSCQGFTFPNSSALSLAPFHTRAGSASALMGGIQMGLGALASAIVSMLSNGTAIPMTGVMACCALASFIILSVGKKVIQYKARPDQVEEESAEMIL